MKKRLSSFFIVSASVIGGGVLIYGLTWGANAYLNSKTAKVYTVNCPGTYAPHFVTIAQNAMTPIHTQARLCDRLSIVNTDDTLRLIAFGRHDSHKTYNGVTEKIIGKGESLTVTLDQAGMYSFHDHNHDDVAGDITITP